MPARARCPVASPRRGRGRAPVDEGSFCGLLTFDSQCHMTGMLERPTLHQAAMNVPSSHRELTTDNAARFSERSRERCLRERGDGGLVHMGALKHVGVAAWFVGIAACIGLSAWFGIDDVASAIGHVGWGILP